MLTVIRSKRPKIAFFCGADGDTFLSDIRQYLQRRFEIRDFTGRTKEELYELMQWSDISWFEWCTDLAVLGSNRPQGTRPCKTIIRLHRYEAYTPLPCRVNWRNVDVLITVGNSYVKKALLGMTGPIGSAASMVTIPSGVNIDRLEFAERPRGKNIAFLGNLRMVKNPSLLLQCMHRLCQRDPDGNRGYRLFIAGAFQDGVVEQYMRQMAGALDLSDNVFFDGWQGDVNGWLSDKHYIVSTSMIESQGMGVLQGMACGLKPVIHNFPGAAEIYPDEFLFNTCDEFCEQVLSAQYTPAAYREFVEKNYSLKQQLAGVNGLITGLEKEIDTLSSSTVTEKGSLYSPVN